MPPKGDRLTKTQSDALKRWIEEGAEWPESITLQKVQRVDFTHAIKPLFEVECVACHRDGFDRGGLRLDTRELAFKGGDSSAGIVAFRPKQSRVYVSTTLSPEDDGLMPPAKKGGPLPKDKIELLARWIREARSGARVA